MDWTQSYIFIFIFIIGGIGGIVLSGAFIIHTLKNRIEDEHSISAIVVTAVFFIIFLYMAYSSINGLVTKINIQKETTLITGTVINKKVPYGKFAYKPYNSITEGSVYDAPVITVQLENEEEQDCYIEEGKKWYDNINYGNDLPIGEIVNIEKNTYTDKINGILIKTEYVIQMPD